jgi:hypothetical protein
MAGATLSGAADRRLAVGQDLTPALRTGTLNPHSVAIASQAGSCIGATGCVWRLTESRWTQQLSPEWPALW